MQTTNDRSDLQRRWQRRLVQLFGTIGVVVCISLLHGIPGSILQWGLIVTALALGALPLVQWRLNSALQTIRQPSDVQRCNTAIFISCVASLMFLAVAYVQAWDFILRYQDEHSFMIQMQMLARGRLWMPPLPPEIADFFSAFALFTQPIYGSIYLPGTALMYVPAIWLHLPYWVLPVIGAGVCVGLTYRIITELTDGVGGMLAATMMISLPAYRSLALMLLSQTPMLLLGLLVVWTWLRWRTDRRWRWIISLGLFSGWAVITRPLDALAYVLPVWFVVLRDLVDAKTAARNIMRAFSVIGLSAMPFLAIAAIQNRGMTGNWLQSPYVAFAKANYPAPMFGFHEIDWSRVPLPKLAEDHEMTEDSFWPTYRAHRVSLIPSVWWNERLPRTIEVTMPHSLLAGLIPIGLLGLTDRRRRLLAATAGLFLLLYVFAVWYQAHYVLTILPGMLLLAVLGIERIRLLWPKSAAGMALLVVAMSIGALTRTDADNWSPWLDLVRIEHNIAALPNERAVVLFVYHPRNPSINYAHHEPVYNTTAAWPDEAQIIRAHDLGAENIRLFQYYARTQPSRVIYRYDRDGDVMTKLGTPAEALAIYHQATTRNDHGR